MGKINLLYITFIYRAFRKMKKISILIPHYKTLKMTQLCLALIKKNTDLKQAEVIVIDNGSNDDSSAYLQTLDWITLITREKIEGEPGARAHCNALDLALKQVNTLYFVSIHTDTFMISPHWLDFLLKHIEQDENIAGVGSWKLDYRPLYLKLLGKLERFLRMNIWYPLVGKPAKDGDGVGENHFYLRSHCALYRTEKVKVHTNGFGDEDKVAGKVIHRKLLEQGCEMIFLDSDKLSNYMRHLNHATIILNPELSRSKVKKTRKIKKIKKELSYIETLLKS